MVEMDRRQRWRINNPYRYRYQGLKHCAKQRNVPFNLSFEEYCNIPDIEFYMVACGRGKWDLTLDRIKPLSQEPRGYCSGNIQVMPNCLNAQKRRKEYDPKPIDSRLENSDIACPF